MASGAAKGIWRRPPCEDERLSVLRGDRLPVIGWARHAGFEADGTRLLGSSQPMPPARSSQPHDCGGLATIVFYFCACLQLPLRCSNRACHRGFLTACRVPLRLQRITNVNRDAGVGGAPDEDSAARDGAWRN